MKTNDKIQDSMVQKAIEFEQQRLIENDQNTEDQNVEEKTLNKEDDQDREDDQKDENEDKSGKNDQNKEKENKNYVDDNNNKKDDFSYLTFLNKKNLWKEGHFYDMCEFKRFQDDTQSCIDLRFENICEFCKDSEMIILKNKVVIKVEDRIYSYCVLQYLMHKLNIELNKWSFERLIYLRIEFDHAEGEDNYFKYNLRQFKNEIELKRYELIIFDGKKNIKYILFSQFNIQLSDYVKIRIQSNKEQLDFSQLMNLLDSEFESSSFQNLSHLIIEFDYLDFLECDTYKDIKYSNLDYNEKKEQKKQFKKIYLNEYLEYLDLQSFELINYSEKKRPTIYWSLNFMLFYDTLKSIKFENCIYSNTQCHDPNYFENYSINKVYLELYIDLNNTRELASNISQCKGLKHLYIDFLKKKFISCFSMDLNGFMEQYLEKAFDVDLLSIKIKQFGSIRSFFMFDEKIKARILRNLVIKQFKRLVVLEF